MAFFSGAKKKPATLDDLLEGWPEIDKPPGSLIGAMPLPYVPRRGAWKFDPIMRPMPFYPRETLPDLRGRWPPRGRYIDRFPPKLLPKDAVQLLRDLRR